MENTNEKEKCETCHVSKDTIESLKKEGREEYLSKKQEKQDERQRKLLNRKIKKAAVFSLLFLLAVGGIAAFVVNYSPAETGPVSEKQKITVFYSPTCSCCGGYISYLKRNGFEVLTDTDMVKRMDILDKYKLSQDMTSCHTSLVDGYFAEGHIPADVIRGLLEEGPEIDGIVIPGMPQGSPGMPGIKFGKWTIYGMSDGMSSEFMIY